jgi:pyruvate/2-oxoglutarate dehydrogenase complex dihydrolipoamide dehydrogenase (E3) component
VEACGANILLNNIAHEEVRKRAMPDLVVWATGASPQTPRIPGLDGQYAFTALELLEGAKQIRGPRVLVIGAGRVGLEAAEKLGRDGYQVVATKRTDPIGGMMEAITRKLALKRIGRLANVILMPHTTVKSLANGSVELEQDGVMMSLEPFQTVILATGMAPAQEPGDEIRNNVPDIATIGDARDVRDIFTAVRAGYQLAQRY